MGVGKRLTTHEWRCWASLSHALCLSPRCGVALNEVAFVLWRMGQVEG